METPPTCDAAWRLGWSMRRSARSSSCRLCKRRCKTAHPPTGLGVGDTARGCGPGQALLGAGSSFGARWIQCRCHGRLFGRPGISSPCSSWGAGDARSHAAQQCCRTSCGGLWCSVGGAASSGRAGRALGCIRPRQRRCCLVLENLLLQQLLRLIHSARFCMRSLGVAADSRSRTSPGSSRRINSCHILWFITILSPLPIRIRKQDKRWIHINMVESSEQAKQVESCEQAKLVEAKLVESCCEQAKLNTNLVECTSQTLSFYETLILQKP